jgi:hypothetical protein
MSKRMRDYQRKNGDQDTPTNRASFVNAQFLAGEQLGIFERLGEFDENGRTVWKSNLYGRDDIADDDPIFKRLRKLANKIYRSTPDAELEARVNRKQ